MLQASFKAENKKAKQNRSKEESEKMLDP